MPMIVTTISAPAMSQPIAIQIPPKTTQRMLRRSGSGPIGSPSEIAELAPEIDLARGDLALHHPEPPLEIAKAAPAHGERVVGRGGDAAPERRLLLAAVERRRPLWQRDRQKDVGERRRHDEEHEPHHKGEADDDALDTEIVGDAGADTGKESVLGIAIEAMARLAPHVSLPPVSAIPAPRRRARAPAPPGAPPSCAPPRRARRGCARPRPTACGSAASASGSARRSRSARRRPGR